MNLRGGGGGAIAKATRWGRVGAFVAGKEGLCGPACGGGDRGPSGWEAVVLGKGVGFFRDPLAAQWRMGDCRGADERRRRFCLG